MPPGRNPASRAPGVRSPCSLPLCDHRASEAWPGVASGLRLVVVGVAMNDEAAADDVRRSRAHRDGRKREARARVAIGVRLEVRHVARVMLGRGAAVPVGLAARIEVPARAHAVARAAVALLLLSEAMLRVGLDAGYLRSYQTPSALLRAMVHVRP